MKLFLSEVVTLGRTGKVTPQRGTMGGGGRNPSWVSYMLPCFEKILPLVCDVLYKMSYILWVVALLGACDVTI